MALPLSGQLCMSAIRTELGIPSQAPFCLDVAENGGYVALNICSPYKPSSTDPACISEWYGYCHTCSCATVSCGGTYTGAYPPFTPSQQRVDLILTSTPNGSSIFLQFDAIDRPNRFTLYDSVDPSPLYTSGWIGSTSATPGPWNPPGTTPKNFTFTYNSSRTYWVIVDISADTKSDGYTIAMLCTAPPPPTPTPTPSNPCTSYYSVFLGYDPSSCSSACNDYNIST